MYNLDDLYKKLPMYYTQPKLSLESNVLDPDPRGSGFKSPGGSGSVFPI